MAPTVIPDKLYYRIGEVEAITEVPAYVLRYWESEFKLLRPKKNPAGQRLYRRKDLDLVLRIKSLLYDERLTLEGAKKRLRNESRANQMDLGLRGAALEEALRRLRERLRAQCGLGRGVAQPGSALDWGSRGRWFKSSRPDQFLLAVMGRFRTVVPCRRP